MFGKKSFREWKRDLQKEMMLLNEKIRGAKKNFPAFLMLRRAKNYGKFQPVRREARVQAFSPDVKVEFV